MYEFISILFIVFGVLQIVLFFKIWGMTNRVSKIEKEITGDKFLSEACYQYLLGNIEETEKLLNDAFLRETSMLCKNTENRYLWQDDYKIIVAKYTRAFKKNK